MAIRYSGHLLRTRHQASLQTAAIVAVLLPLLAWRITTERRSIAMALAGLIFMLVVTAFRAWRFLAVEERQHPVPTDAMAFVFGLFTTLPLVMGAFLMILLFEVGR